MIGFNINQLIIIISDSVNTVLAQLEGVSVFLLAAVSLKDTVRLAILGEDFSKEVICVPKEDAVAVMEVLSEIEVQ